jgi:hypothetical protein
MLEGLGRIDWASLQHAYGPAADVPGLVRALAAEDAAVRQDALHALFGNVWHQGTVYEATSYVVPFLVELALSPLVLDQAGILSLLAEIADGHSYREVHETLRTWADRGRTPEHEAQKARELEWVRLAHEAVDRATDALLLLVERDANAHVRAAAASVVGRFPEHAGEIGPRLVARVPLEDDAPARATLLYALGRLGDPAAVPVIDAALRDPMRVVVLVAAVARAALPSPSDACIGALLAAIEDPELVDAEMQELPYDHRDASAEACAALAGLGRAAAPVLPRLAQVIRRCDPFRATEIGAGMLEIAFAADDGAARRLAIAALADSDPFWATKSERLVRARMLENRGLPTDREALRARIV